MRPGRHPLPILAAVWLCWLILWVGPSQAGLPAEQVWTASGGEVRLELRADYLPDFGLEIVHDGQTATRVVGVERVFTASDHLVIEAPYGNFERFVSGQLQLDTGWLIRHRGKEVRLDGLTLTPGLHENGHPTLEARDPLGRHLLTFHHLHVAAEHHRSRLTIHNAGLTATPILAELLDFETLDNLALGMAWFDLQLAVPLGADTSGRGPSCADRPQWPQDGHKIDVAMWEMNQVAYQGRESGTGRIKVAPDATLKNVGTGDVPWIPKFSALGAYPYAPPDQHPYLVWNMYRISDDRIEQLGASGVKHAFFSLNFNCTINCGSGNILWPGCEDVYSAGTNDSNFNQGPRADVQASEGLFFSTCSFFDPNCTGSQTQNSGSFENRLMVDPGQLQTPDADYFLDAWYVIQHDIDIWNSMAHRRLNPAPAGTGWSFGPLGPFNQGRALDQWVDPDNPGPNADHVAIVVPSATPEESYPDDMPQGHIHVAVKVIETSDGYRYNYAVQNFDFDRGIEAFRVPFPENAQLFDVRFGGVDGEPVDDWSIAVADGALNFEAPTGHALDWFRLFNFEFETNLAPVQSQITLDLGGDAVVPTWTEAMLGPDAQLSPIPNDALLETVFPAGTFDFPVALRHAADGSQRRFVVERSGRIRIVDAAGNLLPDPFLDIAAQVDTFFEGGLLGLAFHPAFPNNGKFYVYFTATGSPLTTRIVEFEIDGSDPNQADPASQRNILSIPQPAGNHNGGDLHFGPDGFLYIGLGDGGPSDQSQNPDTLLGSMLRIDVDNDDFPAEPDRNYAIPSDNPLVGATGRDETWAWGLRNPYRFSFDRATGDLWISDVGQVTWEEVNLQPAGDPGGQNYGWDVCEGNWLRGSTTQPCSLPGSTLPVIEYQRTSPNCSITGGYRYRGPFPSLQGLYAYGDYCSGQVWLAREEGGDWISETFENVGFGIVGFGEDESGNLYLLRQNGEVLRFEADAEVTEPNLTLDSQLLEFGDVQVGEQVTLDVVLENTGTASLAVSSLELPGAPFGVDTDSCGGVSFELAPADTCVLNVTFAPLDGGAFETQVTIVSNAASSPDHVDLSGTGIVGPGDLDVTPMALNFGGVPAGGSASLPLILTNVAAAGAADLELLFSVIAGADFFEIDAAAGDCGPWLAAQASCTLSVRFSPPALSSYAGVLRILADGQAANISLQGSGTEPEPIIFEDRFEPPLPE